MNMKKNLALPLLAILPLFSPMNTEAQENVTEINPHEKKTEVMTEAKREKRLDELLQDVMIYGSDKNIENIEKSFLETVDFTGIPVTPDKQFDKKTVAQMSDILFAKKNLPAIEKFVAAIYKEQPIDEACADLIFNIAGKDTKLRSQLNQYVYPHKHLLASAYNPDTLQKIELGCMYLVVMGVIVLLDGLYFSNKKMMKLGCGLLSAAMLSLAFFSTNDRMRSYFRKKGLNNAIYNAYVQRIDDTLADGVKRLEVNGFNPTKARLKILENERKLPERTE